MTDTDAVAYVFREVPAVEIAGRRYFIIEEDQLRRIVNDIVAAAGRVTASRAHEFLLREADRAN
jgi:hypothetical protein